MALSCTYAASGKKAGRAAGTESLTTPAHKAAISAWNAGVEAEGSWFVCGSEPGSAVVVVTGGLVEVVDEAGDLGATPSREPGDACFADPGWFRSTTATSAATPATNATIANRKAGRRPPMRRYPPGRA